MNLLICLFYPHYPIPDVRDRIENYLTTAVEPYQALTVGRLYTQGSFPSKKQLQDLLGNNYKLILKESSDITAVLLDGAQKTYRRILVLRHAKTKQEANGLTHKLLDSIPPIYTGRF